MFYQLRGTSFSTRQSRRKDLLEAIAVGLRRQIVKPDGAGVEGWSLADMQCLSDMSGVDSGFFFPSVL